VTDERTKSQNGDHEEEEREVSETDGEGGGDDDEDGDGDGEESGKPVDPTTVKRLMKANNLMVVVPPKKQALSAHAIAVAAAAEYKSDVDQMVLTPLPSTPETPCNKLATSLQQACNTLATL
jgi:hypothetical protein